MRRKKVDSFDGMEMREFPSPPYPSTGKIPVRVVAEDESVLMDKLSIQHPQTKFYYKVDAPSGTRPGSPFEVYLPPPVQEQESTASLVFSCLGSFLGIMTFPIALGIFVLVAMGAGESTPWCITEPSTCLCATAVQAKLEDLGLEYCKNYVTWPVKSSAFTIDSDYLAATEAAKAYYLNNKNRTLSDDHDDLDPDPGVYTQNLLSYQPYWGCVLNFPHCKQDDSSRAHCKFTCKEFNRRARSGNDIPKVSCSNLPNSDCSSGIRVGVSVFAILMSVVFTMIVL